MRWIHFIKNVFLFFFLAAFIFAVTSLATAGIWMPKGDDLKPSDVVVVLSGNPMRTLYAADLYQKGVAPKIYLSRPVRSQEILNLEKMNIDIPREEDINKKILLYKGVSENDIVVYGQEVTSTIEELEELSKALPSISQGVTVVTSPYHVFRSRLILREKFSNLKARVTATPYEEFPEKWWSTQPSARNVILECTKIIFYFLGGAFRLGGAAT